MCRAFKRVCVTMKRIIFDFFFFFFLLVGVSFLLLPPAVHTYAVALLYLYIYTQTHTYEWDDERFFAVFTFWMVDYLEDFQQQSKKKEDVGGFGFLSQSTHRTGREKRKEKVEKEASLFIYLFIITKGKKKMSLGF